MFPDLLVESNIAAMSPLSPESSDGRDRRSRRKKSNQKAEDAKSIKSKLPFDDHEQKIVGNNSLSRSSSNGKESKKREGKK
jgi:hypothetical protein